MFSDIRGARDRRSRAPRMSEDISVLKVDIRP